ncbi:MAG: MerR family transcriptional regulator [Deltaproteobacteria bacterium]|nr:MerR family transcriptional regulator [Deltaproteobacteria bacterium]
MTLRIRTISRITGVREATLRAWEKRYGFPRPSRGENGYRMYSRDEVEAVRRVARLVQEGMAISEAIAEVRSHPTQELPPLERISERFWSAVMVLDAEGAQAVLREAAQIIPAETLADGVLLPLLREMTHRLDIAREHLASALVRQTLRNLLHEVEVPVTGPCIVLACPPKDLHEGGLLAMGLKLRRRGWKVVMLGLDTPAEALASAVNGAQADAAALSFVRTRELAEFAAVLAEMREKVPVPLFVGGPGARPHLPAVNAAGAHFADSADELVSAWELLPKRA